GQADDRAAADGAVAEARGEGRAGGVHVGRGDANCGDRVAVLDGGRRRDAAKDGGIVDGGDGDGQRLWGGIEVHATAGRAAVVLGLERERRIGGTVLVEVGEEFHIPRVAARHGDHLGGGDRQPAQLQNPVGREG